MPSLVPNGVVTNGGTDGADPKTSTAASTPPVSKKLLKCQKVATKYQKKFPAVEPLRSQDLHHLFLNTSRDGEQEPTTSFDSDNNAPIFVDVRSAAERAVSVIEGSMTLDEFQADQADDCIHAQLLQESPVIVYCTIGYRSGLEATRLHQQYPGLKIFNLDSICLYAQAAAANKDLPRLVDPETGEPATQIHTFGKQWDFVDRGHYESVHFGGAETALRMVRVGFHAAVRHTQTVVYHLNCCREKHSRRIH